MPAPEIIRQLVDRFEQHRESYRSGKYNETQLNALQNGLQVDGYFQALA